MANQITPVILSGGAGSRLWPLSRKALPKQLLKLASDRTMIQETAARARGEGFAPPLVVSGDDHRFLIAEQLRAAGVSGAQIVLEPLARGTAPAAAVAALMVVDRDADGLVLLMPSDHVVTDQSAFEAAVLVAKTAALSGALVTFGIQPTGPETGYGYIKGGVETARGVRRIDWFVEKPDRATAEGYIASGDYFWNSGMFLFRAQSFLDELQRLQPQMLAACRAALAGAARDLDFVRLEEKSFAASPSDSIDYAVMEHAGNAVVVPVEIGWSDVGSWQSLWEISDRDAAGNVVAGDVLAQDVQGSYLRSEGPLLAALGVENLVVVATKDAVMVAHRDASQDVRKIVDALAARGGDQHIHHAVVHRPWGSYESLASGPGFQVKRITVKPGGVLSLQTHARRAEHWVVVSGEALVTCADRQFPLAVNESTYIPVGARHRLENPGNAPLIVVEIQSGAYLGEDDIVRFDDIYGRGLAR